MTQHLDLPEPIHVVLADANVLYPRVLRDYLLYAADAEIIAIAWSRRILDEATTHLVANVAGFTAESGQRLARAMNRAFPYAEVEPGFREYRMLAGRVLPDEGDRHVLAAALAADATTLCTANTRDFPVTVVASLGIEVMTADALLARLIADHPTQMLAVHATAVSRLPGATDATTIRALRRAGSPTAAARMAHLIEARGRHQD